MAKFYYTSLVNGEQSTLKDGDFFFLHPSFHLIPDRIIGSTSLRPADDDGVSLPDGPVSTDRGRREGRNLGRNVEENDRFKVGRTVSVEIKVWVYSSEEPVRSGLSDEEGE